jgi:sec-independent protein translocase protein TatA
MALDDIDPVANLYGMIGDVLQPTHLIFILVVALLVLGPKRLPEVGKSLGKGIRDFRGALSGIDEPAPAEPAQPVPPASVAPVTAATTMATNGGAGDSPAPEAPATAPAVQQPVASAAERPSER